jgi:preprotein translocase subunit SecF
MIGKLFNHYWIYLVLSLLVIVPGMVCLVLFGLKPSIDFTGGSLLEVQFTADVPATSDIEERLKDVVDISSIQTSGERSVIVRSKPLTLDEKEVVIQKLQDAFPSVQELRFESVGPVLGRELLIKTVFAVLIVAVVIALYIMRQFSELKYGIAAVLAMFHDTAVLFAVFTFLGMWRDVEVDVLFVTAVLTTLSFSVHDTIVFFDRIRELRRKQTKTSLRDLVNVAAVQTLGRSINNSLTIIIMLLALVLLGGESIRWFSVALLVGAITGTYSSTFTAVPLLLLWEDIAAWKKKRDAMKPAKSSSTKLSSRK